MDGIVAAVVVVTGLLGLIGLAGAVYANLRSSALEASNRRLSTDNEYYLRKVNYLEPRVEALERENETLQKLHNPIPAINSLRDQEGRNHKEAMKMLRLIHRDLGGNGDDDA